MLTADQVRFRVRAGQVRPDFLLVDDSAVRAVTHALVTAAEANLGQPRQDVEAALSRAAADHAAGPGLAKLTLDRCTFAAPDGSATTTRLVLYAEATRLLRGCADDTSLLAHTHALRALRDPTGPDLYADLPSRRPLAAFASLTPAALVQRYNVALVQGVVIRGNGVRLRTPGRDAPALRGLLRWLKFHRLVAEVSHVDGELCLDISGPAALASTAAGRTYGLQLAQFVARVPGLRRWRMAVELQVRKRAATLCVSEANGLHAPPLTGALPADLGRLADALAAGPWAIAAELAPRHTGACGMLVPDFLARHRTGCTVAVELFHRADARRLARRVAQLHERPDATLLLGVDRRLGGPPAGIAAFAFRDFPTPRALRAALDLFVRPSGPAACYLAQP